MQALKSATHHWWPRCVSEYWTDSKGFTNRVDPNDKVTNGPSKSLGGKRNGHHIKFSDNKGEFSSFDSSFESIFDTADSNFPKVIDWLNTLPNQAKFDENLTNRFIPVDHDDNLLKLITECIVSLIVRNPQNRNASIFPAMLLRGEISKETERNRLISLNIQHMQRMIADHLGDSGKFVILFSDSKEFIYGDGVYNDLAGLIDKPITARILIPITPTIAVMYSKPISYTLYPKLYTMVLTDEEVEWCNLTTQVYSKDELFYRHEKPKLTEHFTCREHLQYPPSKDPLDIFFNNIPGVSSFI